MSRMSRIGKQPVSIPQGVRVELDDRRITVTGPRGSLSEAKPTHLNLEITDTHVTVIPKQSTKIAKSLHGLYRQLIKNMITGVTDGFVKSLEMKGTGYRAEAQGSDLVISAGYSHPVRITAPDGITFAVEKNVNIKVQGNSKQAVGETAAKIRAVRPPEPYKGKGIRYAGEVVRLKPGKAAKAAS